MLTVQTVAIVQGFRVELEFSTGERKVVDLEPLLRGPIFERLRNDYSLFQTVHVDEELGTIVWNNGADLDPNVLLCGRRRLGMDDWYVELSVVYQDLPDLIEIETLVRFGDWSGRSRAYASPDLLENDARNLIAWSRAPRATFALEAGADTGIGWLLMKFFTIDAAGHARCAITLATGGASYAGRPSETWRLAIEIPTELGLIERFGNECSAMGRDYSRTARLIGVPT